MFFFFTNSWNFEVSFMKIYDKEARYGLCVIPEEHADTPYYYY